MKITKLLSIFYVSAFVLLSCEQKKETATDTSDSTEQKYECPMHPEVTGKEGDACSTCGMKLMKARRQQSTEKYRMEFSMSSDLEAGKAATLMFTPKLLGREQDSVPLDIQHDKKIHLIVVSKDLSYFDHIHPQRQANGSYEIKVLAKGEKYSKAKFQNETHFDQGGDYVMFADYLPTGGTHQLERIELKVTGATNRTQQFTQEKLSATADGYEVSLQPKDGKLVSGALSHIAAIVKKDGKEISADQFENYLAAKAHVVVISEDTQNYLHVHPDVSNGRLDLHTTFDKGGIYRGWLQFQTGSQVHTADFVLKVEQGATSGASDAEHHH